AYHAGDRHPPRGDRPGRPCLGCGMAPAVRRRGIRRGECILGERYHAASAAIAERPRRTLRGGRPAHPFRVPAARRRRRQAGAPYSRPVRLSPRTSMRVTRGGVIGGAIATALLSLPPLAIAQSSVPPELKVSQITGGIHIDGW